MRILVAIAIWSVIGVLSVASQNASTTVRFDEPMFDFGKIREVDGPVSHTFTYWNTGKIPFVIYDIRSSCGCTTPKYDRSPLLSGQSRTLTVTFDPANQPGRIEKTIVVLGNVDNGYTTLKIRATVEPRPRTVEDDFPVTLTDGVRLQDLVMELDNQPNSIVTTHTLGVVNTSDKAVEVAVAVPNKIPEWASVVVAPKKLQAGQRGMLVVTVDPVNKNLWGRKAFPIPLTVGGRTQFTDVIASMVFVEDLSRPNKGEAKPALSVNNAFYHFSTVRKGTGAEYAFKLRNVGDTVLNIRFVDAHMKYVLGKWALKPGETTELKVKLPTEKSGAVNEIIRVISNDPLRPSQELRVMATVTD